MLDEKPESIKTLVEIHGLSPYEMAQMFWNLSDSEKVGFFEKIMHTGSRRFTNPALQTRKDDVPERLSTVARMVWEKNGDALECLMRLSDFPE